MPRYTVTYTTDTRPDDLPDGATVEKISALPLEVCSGNPFDHTLYVNRSVRDDDDLAFISVDLQGAHLNRDQTIQVRDALNELLGETAPEWDGHSEPPADVVETKDKDGDHWFRCDNDGWAAYAGGQTGDLWDYPHGGYPAKYGPHTIVRRK